jgi:hypothetical protein
MSLCLQLVTQSKQLLYTCVAFTRIWGRETGALGRQVLWRGVEHCRGSKKRDTNTVRLLGLFMA